MSDKQLPPLELPGRLSAMAILGLNNAEEGDWSRLRGLQYATLAKVTRFRLLAHAICAMLVVRLYLDVIGFAWLVLWSASAVGVIYHITRGDQLLRDAENRSISRSEFRRQAWSSVVIGLIWAVPSLAFAPFGAVETQAALWTVLVILMIGSIMFYTIAPLGTVILAVIVGGAAMIGFAVSGMWIICVVIALFLAIAIGGTIEIARTHLIARIAEVGVAEKDEVVSLLLREFEENEADWLWQVDTARRVRSISPRFAFALGCVQGEAEGKPLLELIAGKSWGSGQFPTSLHDLAERLKHRENFSNLLVHVSIKGEQRWWELSGTPIRDERGNFTGFRGVGSDVTEQRESSEKIAYLARYDTLTSLPNRLQLTEALGEALRYSEQWRARCAFLMVDLDRFKAVNDSLGHMVGDKLLAQVSQRLQSLMGETEMCGRLGGDEFAIVIRDASDRKCIETLARRVINRLSEPYLVNNHTLYVGASVGSAIGPRDGRTVEELMRNADLALYRAKDEGGGEHFPFEPMLHATAEERRQLEVALRSALKNDEFLLHYQPVVDAVSEEIVSFEALVRWNSAEHGFISPGKFIPLAEDTRLIVPIGRWVLHAACKEACNWPENIKINVNVSPEQLMEPDFNDEVVHALAATGLAAERLEIEVTESIFLRDATVARKALEQVMALGCSVALDDFGTGYSSLGYLRKLHFSTIKVDRTFVQGAAQDHAESLAIIRAVVAMADSLGMTTTAEGAETAEEAKLIRELGCTKIQGFYFGRPMVAKDALKLFAEAAKVRA